MGVQQQAVARGRDGLDPRGPRRLDETQEPRQRPGHVIQRSFSGELELNSMRGTFFSTPGMPKGTHEAMPKLPELPNDAALPGSPFSMSRTLKPSRCR